MRTYFTAAAVVLGFASAVAAQPGAALIGAMQNFPAISSAATSRAIRGPLNSKANQTLTVQRCVNPACARSGQGESGFYIGQTTVTTNASGNASLGVARVRAPDRVGRQFHGDGRRRQHVGILRVQGRSIGRISGLQEDISCAGI